MSEDTVVQSNLPNIVILYGGTGVERNVSLVSGRAVMAGFNFDISHKVTGIRLEKNCLPSELNPASDVVLLALHGEYGEDGEIQRELEAKGFQFSGSDSLSSALCMNKVKTKETLREKGIPVVPGMTFSGKGLNTQQVIDELGKRIIAKPVSMGSSVGLELLEGRDEIRCFLESEKNLQQVWLLEKRIFGREFSVGVLDSRSMGIVEIILPENRVYDYEQKYHRDDTRYECPAQLSEHDTQLVKQYAERVFSACGCRDYARIDFLYDTGDGQWYCLELNTLPGMTPTSLLPKSAGACGLTFEDLLLRMISPAIGRHNQRRNTRNV